MALGSLQILCLCLSLVTYTNKPKRRQGKNFQECQRAGKFITHNQKQFNQNFKSINKVPIMKSYSIQTKEKVWKDEAGNNIPSTHIKPVERVNEKVTGAILLKAIKVSEQLAQLKSFIADKVDEAFEAFRKSYEGRKEDFKGNITIFNFDRSIKIEVRVTDAIQFDDLTISAAKAKLDEFLRDGIQAKESVIKEMVLDAFSTARGKLDVKKILGLKRYSDRIKDVRYSEAMSLIDQAIRRPQSATYYRVWVKTNQGQYEAVPLALSDV